METNNRVVVITGASGDIGRPVVEYLLKSGYVVAACVRNSDGFSLFDDNENLKYFACDFSDNESIISCVADIKKEYKNIYGLVNCIGVAHGSSFLMTKPEDLHDVFKINYFSIMFFIQLLVKKMIKTRNGSIVNIASTAGILSDKGTMAYGSSKAALIHSSKVLATELGAYGIRVNVIAPAVVESKMSAIMDEESVLTLNTRAAIAGSIYPQDVVDMIVYLLSDSARNITKQVIKIDRGILD
ncbi:SDR family NAD(P)-dependent oxidoreductase [Salinispirillum marinum]|uniref:SDR family NAD(P)-dependent oxidoreductase n=2 Tax=Saccharospirillaceae TaxID=255527 RepID=A0ABV8BG17_9GAMM